MKTGTIVAVCSVIVIVLIVGFVAFKPESTQAPSPSQEPEFSDVTEGTTNLGQFVQEQPGGTSPADTSESTNTDQQEAESVSETQEAVTIQINDTGFQPSEVTIAAGTTVTFVNNGQAPHWPASDIHPTHQLLPEFDANRALATGGTYSYTFVDAGEWSMHDHLNPSLVGTITVQ